MSKYLDDSTKYLISKINQNNEEALAYIDSLTGSLAYVYNADTAHRFSTLEEAQAVLKSQEDLSKALKRDDKYSILEEKITVKKK